MSGKYPTSTSILGKLISLIVAKHGNVRSVHQTGRLFMRLRQLAITPDLPSHKIEAALERLVKSGEFGAVGSESTEADVAPSTLEMTADRLWHDEVRAQLERIGATYEKKWELSGEIIQRPALTFEPTDLEGVMEVFDLKRRQELFNIRLEDILPALRRVPDGLGTHAVIAELRKSAVPEG
jgi:hypothetical protein